jgi:hypothetical protein
MEQGDDLEKFRPFSSNRNDPLWPLSDAVVHATCLRRDPRCKQVRARVAAQQARMPFWPPPCALCSLPITRMEDHFPFPHFSDDPNTALSLHNYWQLHRECVARWPERARVTRQIEQLQESGAWEGDTLRHVLQELRSIV